MAQAIVHLDEYEDRIIAVAKGKYGMKNKSDTIRRIIRENAQAYLEVRPEFLRKLREREKEKGIPFNSPEELRRIIEKR